MAIEWVIANLTSTMSHDVLDASGVAPETVLAAGQPFQIRVNFKVPGAIAALLTAGNSFRLRAYAESQGPGQEVQLGQLNVVGVTNKTDYTELMNINPNPLLGEGQVFGGSAVSGLYKIVVVIQQLSGGIPTVHSGHSDQERSVFFRAP